ncbi:MAG: GGDEF domain-containing protein [Clostridiales bacterium]|nr:GGDEF domain-containing protein [Clostridiales bacterium]
MIHDIYIIDEKLDLVNKLNEMFSEKKDYSIKRLNVIDLKIALKNIPALIIINEDTINCNVSQICKEIHEDDNNKITPIMVISSNNSDNHKIDILKEFVEYYIETPFNDEYLYYTIINIVKLLELNRTVSPLTGLPGNVQIQAEMKKRLMNKEKFVMLYLDLDNFKAYNDVYGFLKGDEVIKFTARTILKNVHEVDSECGFVGHIGGDDFVAIICSDEFEQLCQNIILDFDYNVLDYYIESDIEKGYIEVENRKGVMEQFPIVSISIGVVEVESDKYRNILEIGEIGAQVKHLSKSIQGSTYVINKRKMP